MSRRPFNITRGSVQPCPKCGNAKSFVAVSQQVAEDGCEVWIECSCGHDPHGPFDRMESVMGQLDKDSILDALGCWNDAVEKSSIKSKKVVA